MVFIAINTRDTAIVFDTYYHIATIGIGKGNKYDTQCLGIYPKTFAVELLAFGLLL